MKHLYLFRSFIIFCLLLLFSGNDIHAQNAADPDITFNIGTGTVGYAVEAISIQSDGKVIIGGVFTTYNGVAKNHIARLNTDGSLDASFNSGTGPNNSVYSTALQSDGKIIVGGTFMSYNGTAINKIARLNTDGS